MDPDKDYGFLLECLRSIEDMTYYEVRLDYADMRLSPPKDPEKTILKNSLTSLRSAVGFSALPLQ